MRLERKLRRGMQMGLAGDCGVRQRTSLWGIATVATGELLLGSTKR